MMFGRLDGLGRVGRVLSIAVLALHVPVGSHAEPAWSASTALLPSEPPVSPPRLLVDPSGDVHVFLAVGKGLDPKSRDTHRLVYFRKSAGEWSGPYAISESQRELLEPTVTLDGKGWFHLVWRTRSGAVLYTRSHARVASELEGWRKPYELANRAIDAHVLAGPDDTLHFAYTSREGDVRYRQSTDGGYSWSEELSVRPIDDRTRVGQHPRLAADVQGRVHLVWTEHGPAPDWGPAGVFYCRSVDRGRTWSPLARVADRDRREINVLADGDGEVHVAWYELGKPVRLMHQWSADGGESWSPVGPIDKPLGAVPSGAPVMAIDGGGNPHLMADYAKGFRHFVWADAVHGGGEPRWSPVLPSPTHPTTDKLSYPAIAMGTGNHLHLAYRSRPTTLWYSERLIDAPAITPRLLPTPAGPPLTQQWSDLSVPLRVLAGLLLVFLLDAALPVRRRPRTSRRPRP